MRFNAGSRLPNKIFLLPRPSLEDDVEHLEVLDRAIASIPNSWMRVSGSLYAPLSMTVARRFGYSIFGGIAGTRIDFVDRLGVSPSSARQEMAAFLTYQMLPGFVHVFGSELSSTDDVEVVRRYARMGYVGQIDLSDQVEITEGGDENKISLLLDRWRSSDRWRSGDFEFPPAIAVYTEGDSAAYLNRIESLLETCRASCEDVSP